MTLTTRSRPSRAAFYANFAADGLNVNGGLTARTGQVFTFSRGGTAGAAMQMDQNGRWTPVGTSTPRLHYVYNASTSSYISAGLLREGAGTNSALGSCSFGDTTYWSNVNTFALAAATSCIAGQTATKHTCQSVASTRREQAVGTFVNGQTDCVSVTIENVDATDMTIAILDATAVAYVHQVTFTWATLTTATIAGSGTSGVINEGNGRYRIWVTGTGTGAGTGAAGNTRTIRYWVTGLAASTKACIHHHAQFEAASSYPSSPIVTVAGAVTRAADLISVPWSRNPEAGTWYVDAYTGGFPAGANSRLLSIGYGGAATSYMSIYNNGSGSRSQHISTAGLVTTADTLTPPTPFSQRIETRFVVAGTGAIALGQSLNGAAEGVTATTAANALDATFSVARVFIGTLGTSASPANLAIRSLCYIPGPETSMANCRLIVAG